MISLIISQKGGAEQRQAYEHDEITVGRVKGNHVMLPKGNVSKRHARLIVRDGRYIVTDLKSTNGTYVNHRRITHATLVREGDRIFIGDYVLRIDAGSADDAPPLPADPYRESSDATPSLEERDNFSSSAADVTGRRSQEVVSHFPIERDPDDSVSRSMPSSDSIPAHTAHRRPTPRDSAGISDSWTENPLPTAGPRTSHLPASPRQSELDESRERQAALEKIVHNLSQQFPEATLLKPSADLIDKLDTAIESTLQQLISADDLSPTVGTETLRQAARDELLELGPLTGLLENEKVTAVRVWGRRVSISRKGSRVQHTSFDFATDAAVSRTMNKLYALADGPSDFEDSFVDVELPDGWRMISLGSESSLSGPMFALERTATPDATIDQLVRDGAISRSMATLLSHCITARINILLVGDRGSGIGQLLAALASTAPLDQTAVWFAPANRNAPGRTAHVVLPDDSEEQGRILRATTRLRPEHLFATELPAAHLPALTDAIMQGLAGVVLSTPGVTVRQAISRLGASLAALQPGLGSDTARHWLGSAFDLGIEVARLRDGRMRVARMTEIRNGQHGPRLHDIFTFAYHRTAAGGAIEGSFYATGTVPRIVEDLAAHGLPLDTSIFKRHPSG